jgi:hypothetical protein
MFKFMPTFRPQILSQSWTGNSEQSKEI